MEVRDLVLQSRKSWLHLKKKKSLFLNHFKSSKEYILYWNACYIPKALSGELKHSH